MNYGYINAPVAIFVPAEDWVWEMEFTTCLPHFRAPQYKYNYYMTSSVTGQDE